MNSLRSGLRLTWWQGLLGRRFGLRWLTLGVMLIVAGSHFRLIERYASDQPFSDQWGAEGHIVFEQWLHGRATWANFFASHAEHRPVLTRLLAFAVFVGNGQWDCRVEMVANVGICVLTAGVLCEFARRRLRPGLFVPVAIIAAGLFAMPSNYENVIWGFQSQFYFLLLFGSLHVIGSCRKYQVDGYWWFAQLSGFLALFSIAAGVASAVALFALAALAFVHGRRGRWIWATLAMNGGFMFYAWWLRPDASVLDVLHAGSVAQFIASAGRMLSWPLTPWVGLFLPLPWVIFSLLPARVPGLVGDQLGLGGLGLWSGLMIAAIAYGRGSTPGGIAVRYFDVLVINLFVNALALACLSARFPIRRRHYGSLVAMWLGLLTIGCWRANEPAPTGPSLAGAPGLFSRQQSVVREFLATGNEAVLTRDSFVRAYFPHLTFTKDVLSDPLLRRRLPPSLVPPLGLVRDAGPRRQLDPDTTTIKDRH